jgi:Chromosome segregation ATPases
MHIKQIIIQNFQSYKYEVIDDISPYANLILGKNGHGKSNIINGILKFIIKFTISCHVCLNKQILTHQRRRKKSHPKCTLSLANLTF